MYLINLLTIFLLKSYFSQIAAVRKLHKKVLIEIEGSVTSKEMEEAVKKGANLVVSGYVLNLLNLEV